MRHALIGFAFLVAGCQSSPPASPPGPPAPMGSSLSVEIGIPAIAAGVEETVCTTVQLPNTTDIDVTQLVAVLAPGSHHLILYRSTETVEAPTPTACMPFEGIAAGIVPILIAEKASTTVQLPTGVAYHFPPNQMVRLEAHYLNASTATIAGKGTVTLAVAPAGQTYLAADLMVMGSLKQLSGAGVPPDTQAFTLDPGFYDGAGKIDLTALKLFALTGHEHHLGAEVTVSKSTSLTDPGTMLYDDKSWDNPELKSFDDAHLLTFAAGEGLRWQCTYDSMDAVPKPTDVTHFGLSAVSNEMCFVWAYYFPSVGHLIMGADGAFQ